MVRVCASWLLRILKLALFFAGLALLLNGLLALILIGLLT